MFIHRNLVEAVIDSLNKIHCEGSLANYVVPNLLKSNKKWGSKDRRQIAQVIYDITRHWRYYAFIANAEECSKEEVWKVFGAYLKINAPETTIAWEELQGFEIDPERKKEADQTFEIKESIPEWLDKEGRKQLGDKIWEEEIAQMNKQAMVVLRVNTTAVPKNQQVRAKTFVQEELLKENIATEVLENYPDALQLVDRKSILHTKAFQNGWVELQDANSQRIAPFCAPAKEQLIIDTCAGAGGKSLHLAALIENEADIFSLDVVPHKIKELEKRARRAKAESIEAGLVLDFPIDEFNGKADIVLIDAPCSGLGTLKRDPDKKWKLTPEFLEEITEVQYQIVQDYAPLTKPGGHLIYATCSILPSENQNQVQRFLKSAQGNNFELVEEEMLFSKKTGFDGFYMAKLQRKI